MRQLAPALALALASVTAGMAGQPQGQVVVYLQPLSQDAGRLEFRVQEILAEAEGGELERLDLLFQDLHGNELTRERRLAFGSLPPGRYKGLAVRVSAARRGREDGAADPLPEAEPVAVDVPFRIQRGEGVVLSLSLETRGSVETDFRFNPVFFARVAFRPPVATLGLVSSPGDDSITLYDKSSGSVVGLVPTGRAPQGLVLDAARRLAYVALADDDTVISLGLLEPRILTGLRLRGGDRPTGLALTPDGTTLLCANSGSRTVSLIDALSMVEIDRITVGDRPLSVVVDSAGSRAYAFNTAASSVTVLDLRNRAVLATIPTEAEPFWGQFDRSGEALFVIHRFSPFVTRIDTASLATARRFVGSRVTAIAVDPRTDLIYLGIEDADTIEIYDPLSFLPLDSISTAGEVSFLSIDGEENNLHLLLPELRQVHVVRQVGQKLVARIDLGEAPYWASLFGGR